MNFCWTVLNRYAVMPRMETLGLSDSTPRSESRIKSLLWPSVQSGADVDYLGAQGYWVCTIIAVMSLLGGAIAGQTLSGVLMLLYFFLGGVGVRERSRYAAIAVFLFYLVDMLVSGVGIVKILFAALLLSNLRATWIAALWKPDSEEAVLPPRLNQTWGDKFADILPQWLWPKVRVLFYVYSIAVFILFDIGLAMMLARRAR
jgi:hypothetical protein